MNIGIAFSQFNEEITAEMLQCAEKCAQELDIHIVKTLKVHGAYDLPLAVKKLLEQQEIDGVVTLGAVIKGDTAHDQLISTALAVTLTDLSLQYNKPVSLGVMGPELNWKLAQQRIESYAKRAVTSVKMSYDAFQHD